MDPYFKVGTAESADFGAGSYLGFETSQGNYGWIRATWNGTDFRLYTAAYESVVGTSILAGAGDTAAVPEIDPSGLASTMSLVMGSAAMLEQRRRKRAVAAATEPGIGPTAAAAVAPVRGGPLPSVLAPPTTNVPAAAAAPGKMLLLLLLLPRGSL